MSMGFEQARKFRIAKGRGRFHGGDRQGSCILGRR